MPAISIIIPVLHEQERINGLIGHLRSQDAGCEIIVVDGDPDGSTITHITDQSVVRLAAGKGRGIQLAAGAAAATGDVVLMLHADTVLPENGLVMIAAAVADGAAWGAFRLGIDSGSFAYRIIELGVEIRCRLFTLPYGDQGLFVRRSVLEQAGGIPTIPLMEDVALARALNRQYGACKLLPLSVQTSARRWQQDGVVRRTLRNWWLLLRYLLGADPVALAKEYR